MYKRNFILTTKLQVKFDQKNWTQFKQNIKHLKSTGITLKTLSATSN